MTETSLGYTLEKPANIHCCQDQGCVTDEDVTSVIKELLDKWPLAPHSVAYSAGLALDAFDTQLAVFEDKGGAKAAYARLEGFREDLEDWLAKFTEYVKHELKGTIETCDMNASCGQHRDDGPDPDRERA